MSTQPCRCLDLDELWDEEATAYADRFLQVVEVRANEWEVIHQCKTCTQQWLEYHPESGLHGGGPLRLTKQSRYAGMTVNERLFEAGLIAEFDAATERGPCGYWAESR